MAFKRIEKKHLSADVCEQIKANIKNGLWKEGDKIPSENELVKELGVSRVSIRSAIDQLRGNGIIETFQGKGSFVAKNAIRILSDSFYGRISISENDYLDMVAFRSALELASIDLIAQRAEKEDLDKISEAYARMERSVDDYRKYTLADYMFHYQIIAASKNKIFIGIMEQNKDLFIEYLEFQNSHKESENFSYSLQNHKAVLTALLQGDTRTARELTSRTFERNFRRLYQKS